LTGQRYKAARNLSQHETDRGAKHHKMYVLRHVTTNRRSAGRTRNCGRSDLKRSGFIADSKYSRPAAAAMNSLAHRLQSYTSLFTNIHQYVYYLPPCKVPPSGRRKLDKRMCTSLSRHVCDYSLRLNDRKQSFLQRCIGIKFQNAFSCTYIFTARMANLKLLQRSERSVKSFRPPLMTPDLV
jgi:hypothetical protein